MGKPFRVRDPVHNFIELNEEEVEVVNTPIFQRLRGIRQLALANLLYPGALHTRFDHSLGVCHVAGMLCKLLGLSEDEIRLVRLAALVHDLGHGPFSHVSEYALELYTDRERLGPAQKKEKIHEVLTRDLISHDEDLERILGKSVCDKIGKLLMEGHGAGVLRALVSGPLDADKQDYLLRDSYFCGVPYGLFDIHQFQRSLILGGDEDNKELMISGDGGVHAVEQYVLAKYYMTSNVYRHRVRLITDQMIIRAIVLGIEEDGLEELKKLYEFNGSAGYLVNYKSWDDSRFLLTFAGKESHNGLCSKMTERLLTRRLLKSIFSRRVTDIGQGAAEAVLRINEKENVKRRERVEKEVSVILKKTLGQGVDEKFVIVNAFDIKSVRTTSRDDEAAILVQKKPLPVPFDEESVLFKSIDERYSDSYVEVYAPVEWTTRTEKQDIREKVREPICKLLGSLGKEANT